MFPGISAGLLKYASNFINVCQSLFKILKILAVLFQQVHSHAGLVLIM